MNWAIIQKIAGVIIGVLIVIIILYAFVPKIQEYRDLQKVELKKSADVRSDQEILDQLKLQQEKLRTDPHYVERVAREEIGMAKPGELIFKFVDDAVDTNVPPRRR